MIFYKFHQSLTFALQRREVLNNIGLYFFIETASEFLITYTNGRREIFYGKLEAFIFTETIIILFYDLN